MRSVRWLFSYLIVASLGLWLAFAVSVKFMAPAHSQDAPSMGDLPPEFLNDLDGAPSAGPATTSPIEPSASATPSAEAPQVPSSLPEPPAAPSPVEGSADFEVPSDVPGDGESSGVSATEGSADGYYYDPSGKRDPFKPFRTVRPILDKVSEKEKVEPLQRWELDKLQVVGILWDVGTPRAMIKDPDGALHTVVRNTRIGRGEGYVTAIREGEVVVLEIRYEDGKTLKENRVMELKK